MRATLGMMRRLLALVPWMVVAAASYGAQSRSAQVIYTHYGPLQEAVYRVANECYAPTFSVEAWGWKVRIDGMDAVITAEGQEIKLPIRTVSRLQTIPLRVAFDKLGVENDWDLDTLIVRSPLKSIKVKNGQIEIASLLSVKPSTFTMDKPMRYVVDVRGASLKPETKLELDSNVRVGQYKPGVVRITVETPDALSMNQGPIEPASLISFPLIKPAEVPKPDPQPPTTQPPQSQPPGEVQSDPASNPDQNQEGDGQAIIGIQPTVTVVKETDRLLNIAIRDFGQINGQVTFRRPEPDLLEIVMPGAILSLPKEFDLGTESVLTTETIIEEEQSIISIRLARPMGAEVVTGDGEILIQLLKPTVGDGRLAGKVIVVDAGHGGSDSGARAGQVLEKNLTLAIAKLTAQRLVEEGATVLMTRRSDVAVHLTNRAKLANDNAADLFVSIHINSTGNASQMTGGITFHHKGSAVSKLLAECIQREIAQISKLPNLGVWSDGKIYQTGFSVLRNTTMPGVLIELGFINHAGDRKRMVTQDFQTKVSQAIVKGLKVFLGDAKE